MINIFYSDIGCIKKVVPSAKVLTPAFPSGGGVQQLGFLATAIGPSQKLKDENRALPACYVRVSDPRVVAGG